MKAPLLMMLLVPSMVLSAPPMGLERAIGLYDSAQFSAARAGFESLLADSSTPGADRDQAQLYLAATFLALKDPAAALARLRVLLTEKPGYEIDPVAFPAELLALGATVKKELADRKAGAAAVKAAPLAPAPAPAPAPVVATASRAPAVVTLGAAVATLGVAAVFTIIGLVNKARLDQRVGVLGNMSPLPESEFRSLAGTTGTQFTVALVCGLSGLALGAIAAILWGT